MADSGPSRRHGWIARVRVIPENGFDSFRDLLETRVRTRFNEIWSPDKSGTFFVMTRTCRIQPWQREGPEMAITDPNGPPQKIKTAKTMKNGSQMSLGARGVRKRSAPYGRKIMSQMSDGALVGSHLHFVINSPSNFSSRGCDSMTFSTFPSALRGAGRGGP